MHNKRKKGIVLYNTGGADPIKELYPKYQWLESCAEIYKVHRGDIYNPPFFDFVVFVRKMEKDEEIKMAWNMVTIGGYIFADSKYMSLVSKFVIDHDDGYMLVKKTASTVFQFPEIRVIDFIIAGAMKGGTTSGIANFSQHPNISMVEEEIHFFDKKHVYQKGLMWYKKHFDYSKQMVGDKAPDVMYQTSCLELLQLVNPFVKIILFLRNPIDRAYSHWKMLRNNFRCYQSFGYCVNDEIENRWNENRLYRVSFWSHLVQRGLYYKQLKEILKFFPKDNIYIAISEKLRANMDVEYQKMFDFLNLPECHCPFKESFVSRTDDVLDKDNELYERLKQIYLKDTRKLEKYLGYKTDWF